MVGRLKWDVTARGVWELPLTLSWLVPSWCLFWRKVSVFSVKGITSPKAKYHPRSESRSSLFRVPYLVAGRADPHAETQV